MMANDRTLLDNVIGFAGALRRGGVPVSVGECVDAARALSHVDLLDREAVRVSLCATLVKREEHLPVFSATFTSWFRAAHQDEESALTEGRTASGRDALPGLPDALIEGNRAALRAAAVMAVAQFGGLDRDHVSSARHHLFRVLRRLDLTRMLHQAMLRADQDGSQLFQLAQLREHAAEFRRMLADEIRSSLVRQLGTEESILEGPAVDDVDFLGATPTQLAAMREAVRPLARRLATRLARRRESRHQGRIDVRRTARRSLPTGGVPIDPAFRRPRVHHPDLFVLCDLSGSVAEFAKFTITLLHALGQELPRTRVFVFVDGVDEVTQLLRQLPVTLDVSHLLASTEAVGVDGHSDYGAVFERFWSRYGADISSTSRVIIAGDGRSNYREPGTDNLRLVHERARRVYWLNPEPRREWGTADSLIDEYTRYCDQLVEVRNLRQLSDFVYRIV